ncbi:MAG: hypothetical protein A2297_01895 [Elusimicrobia bacterium RIFOXYB2_FULL_48_7]|nr:MAG: hypothetical protein A2297_01895 [Elusimicrobia bacterium RIFOXYB2_FULL_48_7]
MLDFISAVYGDAVSSPLAVFGLIAQIIIVLCVFAIIIAIMINFTESKKEKDTRHEKKSIVETGTMFLFFAVYYYLTAKNIGCFNVPGITARITLISIGLLLIVAGSIVNIKGRVALAGNWANQIRVYKDQTFVREGMYRYVRHPLYASLIWMFYGGSLVYQNYASFLATTLVFIPFMRYRANQEEELLKKYFSEYETYQKEVGMFFPKLKLGGKK